MKLIGAITLVILVMFNTSRQEVNSSNPSIFSLQYLVRLPQIIIEHPPVLFLFHGSGSNEEDLFSFAGQLPEEWLVISARAPYSVSDGRYRWYDVKMVDHKITINFRQVEESRRIVLKFMDEMISLYRIDKNRIILAGFSQGANMASIVSLTSPEKVSGFAVFSGRFIEEIKHLISISTSLKSLKCFLAHGSQDYMLPIEYARKNQQMLQSFGIPVTLSEDDIAHSISSKQFENFILWLNQL